MSFKIRVVGTGSAFTKRQCHTSVLIEVNNKKYLLDCGFKVPQTLHDMGIDLKDIDGVIISHVHADHTGGLEELGFMGMYVFNKKFDLYIADDLKDILWDKTLSGGMEDTTGNNAKLEDYFNVHLFSDLKEFNLDDLLIVPLKTLHVNSNKPNYSFILNERVFYSADILFDEALLTTLHSTGIELMFHDCQFFHVNNGVHTSLQELSTLPIEIREKIHLIHYGDNFEEYDKQINELSFTRVKQGDEYKF